MIRYKNIYDYFALPGDEVMEDHLINLQELYSDGFAEDVNSELKAAFSGYIDTPPGEAVRPFAKRCYELLGL